jgi:peptide/nickel transport system substrate-binding protein
MTRKARWISAAIVAAALTLAGCGSTQKQSSSASSDVLRIPYLADMSVPDPDVFYDIEGNSVILNQYEGLLKYAPGSTKIVGSLAKSWTVSPDRLTYTFKLQPGVTFHSGAAMTSSSVKAAFQRRLDVDQAPAYMLKPVKSMSTPDDQTFVIKLKRRVNPFEAYMASSWGPKVIGPAAIKEHAGKDFGQTYLRTKGDGTGPYKLTGFDRGRQYTLTRNDAYWGTKANFKTVLIKITPDIGTQRLELVNGDLDAIVKSFPASELASLPDSLNVIKKDSNLRLLLYVNTNKAPFDDPAVRAGLRSTIDVDQYADEAYAGTATKSAGAYPEQILAGQPALPYAVDDAKAKAAAAKAKTKQITLAYTADESGVQRRVGELLQAKLKTAGYDVTLREVQLPDTYGYIKRLKSAPDLMLQTNTPDAAHPDTWARIVFYSTGGLNFFGFADKQVDKELDDALGAPEAAADKLYLDVGQRVIDSNAMFFLGNVKDVFVVQKDLTGVESVPAYPWTVSYPALKRGGS